MPHSFLIINSFTYAFFMPPAPVLYLDFIFPIFFKGNRGRENEGNFNADTSFYGNM